MAELENFCRQSSNFKFSLKYNSKCTSPLSAEICGWSFFFQAHADHWCSYFGRIGACKALCVADYGMYRIALKHPLRLNKCLEVFWQTGNGRRHFRFRAQDLKRIRKRAEHCSARSIGEKFLKVLPKTHWPPVFTVFTIAYTFHTHYEHFVSLIQWILLRFRRDWSRRYNVRRSSMSRDAITPTSFNTSRVNNWKRNRS